MITARHEAIERLRQEADKLGANAVVSMRLDANQISDGVIAYGAAVVVAWDNTTASDSHSGS
jgi:uncharacterized protein YbjQ (UPF0145 family)